MASIITATTSSGLTQSADNSGVLQLASGTGNLVTVPSVTGTAMVSGNMPAFSAYKNDGNQSVTSGTLTKITFNGEQFDTNNCFASSRFTPTVAGYYQVQGAFSVEGVGTVTRMIPTVCKNGGEVVRGTDLVITGNSCLVSTVIYCNGSTDYLELFCYIFGTSVGVRGQVADGILYTWFSGAMVRGA
jgi:hypothetical protein